MWDESDSVLNTRGVENRLEDVGRGDALGVGNWERSELVVDEDCKRVGGSLEGFTLHSEVLL